MGRVLGVSKNIIAIASLAVGAFGVGSIRNNSSGELSSKDAKTVEQYWVETGLKTDHLITVLSKENCTTSKRNFLACANAVVVLANRVQKHVTTAGEVKNSVGELGFEREVERLKSWGAIEPSTAQFSFVQIASEILSTFDEEQKPAAIGVALNAYLSVAEDPHSYLLPKKYFQEVVSKSDHRSKSMGFIVAKRNQSLVIKKVVPNSPMAEAGVQAGDELIGLDSVEINAGKISHLPEIIKSRQARNNKISITVLRNAQKISVTVPFHDFTYATVNRKWLSSESKVAIIALNKFSKGLCDKVKGEILAAKKEGMRGMILDLRDNSGGQMSEAACVASLFVGNDKPVFTIKYFNEEGPEETYFGKEKAIYKGSLAVLINDGSASAAEILAGVLQDYQRGMLVGSRSFGKGSFQEPEEIEGFNGLYHFKTKGFYYLPSGRTPQITGIMPDLEVKSGFDGDSESNLYLFPIEAPNRPREVAFNHLGKCSLSTNQLLTVSPDVEVEKAAQVLQCEQQ